MMRIALISALLGAALLIGSADRSAGQEMKVEASVDRSRLTVDEALILTVSVSGKNLNNVPEPNLPSLDDFVIVGRTSSTSSNFSIINGQISSSQTIQYLYQLQPGKTGTLTIAPVSVTHGGTTYRTMPITVEVLGGSSGGSSPGRGVPAPAPSSPGPSGGSLASVGDDLYIRAIVDKKQAYLGEQITVTYKLFTRLGLANIRYDRTPSYPGFWMEEMFSAQSLDYQEEIIGGKRYATAVLKRIALFPTAPGKQNIDPLSMVCDVPVKARRSLLDSFFDDPFDPFFSRTQQVTIKTDVQTVEINPLPETGKPPEFKGAVGQFSLKSAVDQTGVEANQPITLTVELSGEGNMKTLEEPILPGLDAFRQYSTESRDEPDGRNQKVGGRKIFSYVLIPLQPGEHTIEPVRFAYFDPSARSYKTLSTGPLRISVTPGKGEPASGGFIPQKSAVTQLRQDIQSIKPETVFLGHQGDILIRSSWYLLIHVFPFAAVAGAYFYRTYTRRLQNDVGYARRRRAYREARLMLQTTEKNLKQGELEQVFAHISHMLYRYIGDKLNQPTTGLTTAQITELLSERGIDMETIQQIRQCLEACDMARFAPTLLTRQSTAEVLSIAGKALETLEQHLAKKI